MTKSAHKIAHQNQVISWIFSPSDSNGKEKDWESGFHYYGARFYWSEVLTGWLSVDPMADKYPSISPYAYCAWNPVKLIDPDGEDCRIAVNHKKKTITISANIILYSKSIGQKRLNNIAARYQNDILKTWSKDKKGENWMYKGYDVVFDVNVSVDQHAVNPKKRDFKSGKNNYIEVVGDGVERSHVDRPTMNTGMWEEPTKDHDAAPHEFAHLLGLKDRYAEYYTKDMFGRKIIGSEPFTGWEGNIMGERDGKVDQRNINAIFNGRGIGNLNNYIKRKNDHEK